MNPKIIAHRGASADCPENTVAAFDKACELNVDGIELDLQLTKDEKVVVFHDSFLEKAGLPEKKINDLEWQELKNCDVGSWFDKKFSDQKIPLLTEILERYSHKTTLLLEIKADEHDSRHDLLVDRVVRLIDEMNVLDSTYLLCFNYRVLQRAAKHNAKVRTVYNLDFFDSEDHKLNNLRNSLSAISINVETVNDQASTWAIEQGKELMVWTCNSKIHVDKAYNKKAGFIMSDKPAWLKKILTAL